MQNWLMVGDGNMRCRRDRGRAGRLALALLLVLACAPVLTASASISNRGPTFQMVSALQVTEEYDPQTGQYSGLFPLLVNNSGDAAGDGALTVLGLPTGWTWVLVEGQGILASVPPGAMVRATVHVEASAPLPGEYPFQVRIDPGQAIMQFRASIPFLGALGLDCAPEAVGGVDLPARLQVIVRNLGNGPDHFDLEVLLPSSAWWYETTDPLTSPTVNISGSYTWSISVHVPYSAEATPEAGPGYRVWFKAVSRTNGEAFAMNMTAVRVIQRRALDLDFRSPLYVQGEAGSVITTEAILENEGNGPEQVTLSAQAPDGWSVQIPKSVRDLGPFERITVAVYLSPGPEASSGDYSVLLTAKAAGTTLSATTVTTVSIPSRSGLWLEGPAQEGPDPSPGGEVAVNFTLRNGGNHLELVRLFPTEVPAGWAVSVSPSLVSLPAWGQVQARATVKVSGVPLEALAGAHTFSISAGSLFSDAHSSLAAQLNVRGVAGLELTAEVPYWAMNPMVDPAPVYIFRLRNTGNVQVTAGLRFTSADGHAGWLRPSRAAITVAPGDIGSFHAAVLAPDYALPGDHSYTVTATTQEASGATAMTDVGLNILEADLQVAGVQARTGGGAWASGANITDGQTVVLVAWLKDLGTDPAGTVQLGLYADGKYVSSRTVESPSVPTGTAWGVTFELHPGLGWHNISVRASVPGERDTTDNEAYARVHVAQAPVPVRETAAVAGTALTTTVVLFAAIMANEGWKFKALLLFVVPLYTRIRPEAALDNFTRGRIYGYVEANPGEHYNAIKKALELPNGSLAHHLDMLIREGYLRFEVDGNYKRFYPSHMRLPKGGSLLAGRPSRIQEIILDTVREEPGTSERAIARALNLSPSTVNYHIRLMATSGLLRLERSLGRTRCYLGEKAPPEGTDIEVNVEADQGT